MGWIRRLAGLVSVAIGVAIFVDGAERGTFSCDRAEATCSHTVERLGRPTQTRTFPAADVLGASYKHSHWDVAPGADEMLARARTLADVDGSRLWVDRTFKSRHSSHSPVVFTRQGLVPLLPGFVPGDVGSLGAVETFAAGGADGFSLVQDDWYSGLPLLIALGGVGALLLLLRGPDPPRESHLP